MHDLGDEFQAVQLDAILDKKRNGVLNPAVAPKMRQHVAPNEGSCIGCRHRAGHGKSAMCRNMKMDLKDRPYGEFMKGCECYSRPSKSGIDLRATSMAKGFVKIAARTSDR